MSQDQLARYSLTVTYRLVLPIILVLAGLMMACSQSSLATKSVPTSGPSSVSIRDDNEPIFTVCEVPPSFPGGNAQLDDYIRQNLRHPEKAIKNKVQGSVFVSFIVNKDGTIRDVSVLKGLGHGTNEEALRFVQTMPNWTPGRQSGRDVNVKYNLAIPFRSDDVK